MINLPLGDWPRSDSHSGDRWRVTVAGDWTPQGAFGRIMIERPEAIYGDLLPVLKNADLALVNVESVLIDDTGRPAVKDGPALRGDSRALAALTTVPFHVACLANNHILDQGPTALSHTILSLRNAGILTVGAGIDAREAQAPLHLCIKGNKLTIINCAEAEESCCVSESAGANGFDTQRLIQQIRDERLQGALVLVIFHGGREFIPVPPPYVVNSLRQLADAGATAIVAHHPHAPQGLEMHNGVPIAYSTGNFLFHANIESYYWNVGYLVHLDFAGNELSGMQITPYQMSDSGVNKLEGMRRQQLLEDLQRISAPLASDVDLREVWHAFIDECGNEFWLNQLSQGIQMMGDGDPKGAAILRNRFFTPAHREAWLDYLGRFMRGEHGTSAEWARDLVRHWLKRPRST